MRNRALFAMFILSVFVFLTAMGDKGGGFVRAPRVEKNFTVTVIDASGKKIEGENFSWEGRVHFAGYLGMAQATIPFDRVKELSVGEKKDRTIKVTARLRDGSETTFDMEADSRCYGEAGFGSFMLRMDEIKAVTFK
jgi:hypothetical protein